MQRQILSGKHRALRTIALNLPMALIGLLFVVPFYWLVITSFRLAGGIMVIPPRFLPYPSTLTNYVTLLSKFNFGLYFANSFIIAVLGLIGQTFSCSMGGFVFARLKFPLKRTLFYLLLSTMMIPGQVTLIPTFVIFNMLKLTNTFVPLILPAYLGGAFGVFLCRQFFLTVPNELEEAAKLDGSDSVGIYWRIFLPIAKPTLATLALFAFMYHWNDLLGPVIYITDTSKRTITVALAMFQDTLRVSRGTIMAGALLSITPLLIVYVFAQQFFVSGMITSGFKE